MLNSIPLACFLIDSETYEIFDCNKAAVNLFCPPPDSLQQELPEFRNPGRKDIIAFTENEIKEACKKFADKTSTFEYIHTTMYGNKMLCEVTVAPVEPNTDDRQVLAYYIKNTEGNVKLSTETKRRRIAEEESKAKTRFLAHMSHEIRTPMNAVLGITEIELHKNDIPKHTKEALARIYSSSNLLLNIINDILDLSKVESGKLEIVNAPYEIANLIADTVQLNTIYIGSKPIEFRLHADKNLPTRLIGDVQRIKQVLNNVLSNAFKYTRRGVVSLVIKSEVSPEGEAALIIKVKDTGSGMTPEQTSLIFESEFKRFKNAENTNVEGTGLGMNIVKQLINLMSGSVSIESELGIGTVITMSIPQIVDSDIVIGEELAASLQKLELSEHSTEHTPKADIKAMPYGRILVVDDVESNLFVARGLLQPYNINVEVTGSGSDAVNKIKTGNKYDIIFMDHMMPGMDGIEATKHIREFGYNEAIIALTANVLDKESGSFEKYGFSGYIAKPVDITQLHECLMEYVYDEEREKEFIETGKSDLLVKTEISPGGEIDIKLIEAALRDIDKTLKMLDNDLPNKDDLKQFIIQIHGVKSALLHINENALSAIAGILEQAGKDENYETIKLMTSRFAEGLRKVTETLLVPENEYADNDDIKALTDYLNAVSEACESYDVVVARNIIKTLKQKKWTKPTYDMIDEISVLLSRSYFEEITVLIQNTLQMTNTRRN